MQGDSFPSLQPNDKLLILGGPQNVGDKEIEQELNFVAQCIEQKTAVFGICLGAQMLAHSLGGKITQLEQTELGWKQMTAYDTISSAFKPFTAATELFLWHGYQFSLPPEAGTFAHTKLCQQHGFERGKYMGVQFHPEWTMEQLAEFATQENWSSEVIDTSAANLDAVQSALFAVLDEWWSR